MGYFVTTDEISGLIRLLLNRWTVDGPFGWPQNLKSEREVCQLVALYLSSMPAGRWEKSDHGPINSNSWGYSWINNQAIHTASNRKYRLVRSPLACTSTEKESGWWLQEPTILEGGFLLSTVEQDEAMRCRPFCESIRSRWSLRCGLRFHFCSLSFISPLRLENFHIFQTESPSIKNVWPVVAGMSGSSDRRWRPTRKHRRPATPQLVDGLHQIMFSCFSFCLSSRIPLEMDHIFSPGYHNSPEPHSTYLISSSQVKYKKP